ncbi:putative bifunctional diguanylate cyclase/phosphodiesterase [Lutibaculum baratangense]|uniref:Diguanylate cyclase/phosphodiesterase (GGDEF & EAL domains) with PAS/PAC sensor(S) n=1 Tax=Lutibaculum baratangense AMV1 TaxID=631454 RepID=V4RHZ6_9HYPH|nr:EAL domain-containing protein [Lutibaculum baratangense]ESR22875.1 diguanylate cyclase/phosphodiesterase (GGDEF & EAL domains) with PAS/PAC sensor(s) [Lutibaculum baratangense AMV1]
MGSSEELRETLVAMERQIDRLRTDNAHATLLIDALEALLCEEEGEHFAGVFGALRDVFAFSQAVVLAERETGGGDLECVAAEPAALCDTLWTVGRFFRKVLDGRVAATFDNSGFEEWQTHPGGGLSSEQPALYLPMRVRNRRGVMILLRRQGEAGFDRSHVSLARKFALLASHAFAARYAHQSEVESQRLRSLMQRLEDTQAALAHRVNHDQLTNLPNRSCIEDTAQRILSDPGNGETLALAFIDLDDFKQVNDAYSHLMGDALLQAVARRIRANVRETDIVGRISGDEFVILFRGFQDAADLWRMAERLKAQLGLPYLIDGLELQATASIGIALHPEHGVDYDTLRRNADTAMYKAKSATKGSVACFDEEMGRAARARVLLERRLHRAVRKGEFRCAFQPKIDLATMRPVGFEALVRWVDGDGRVHQPGAFIDAAGEFGILNRIAEFVIEDVVDQMSFLDTHFGMGTHFSVNVSARQTADAGFMESLIARLGAAKQPDRFVVEVTEDAFVSGTFQSRTLPRLKDLGVSVSIDDFGTGYSSLATLADVTADELKVDRSFISGIHQRPRSQSILRMIESLAGALGMTVVAEGVETGEELDYLLGASSIRLAQGFHFSRPLFPAQLVSEGRLHQPLAAVASGLSLPGDQGRLVAAR